MHLQFHPTTAAPVLAAADKAGHVALWAVRCKLPVFYLMCRTLVLLRQTTDNNALPDVPSMS